MITEKQSIAIKKKLLEQKLTITDLASEFDISRPYLSSVISGARNNKAVEQKLKERFLSKKKGE